MSPGLGRALARNATKICLPWTLGHLIAFGAVDGGFARGSPVTLTAAVAIYAFIGCTVALAIWGNGRALHDLAAATRVVSAGHRPGADTQLAPRGTRTATCAGGSGSVSSLPQRSGDRRDRWPLQ